MKEKVIHIRDNDRTVATLHQPEGMSVSEFEELAVALLLTLANATGRPMAKVEVEV